MTVRIEHHQHPRFAQDPLIDRKQHDHQHSPKEQQAQTGTDAVTLKKPDSMFGLFMKQLEKEIGENKSPLAEYETEKNPIASANHLVNVARKMLKGGDNEVRSTLFDAISQLKNNFAQSDMLSDDDHADIDSMMSHLQKRLDHLNMDNIVESRSSYAFNQSTSGAINITTAEGDVVTININRSQHFSSEETSNADGHSLTINGEKSLNFSMTVEGNLSEEEQQALDAALEDITAALNHFGNGDLKKTIAATAELGEHSNILSSINVEFAQHRQIHASRSVIGSINEQTAPLSDVNGNSVTDPAPDTGAEIANSTDEPVATENTAQSTLIDSLRSFVQQIQDAIDQLADKHLSQPKDTGMSFLESLLKQLDEEEHGPEQDAPANTLLDIVDQATADPETQTV